MKIANRTNLHHNIARRLLFGIGLAMLLALALAVPSSAADPEPSGAEQCAGCHTPETETWQNSPHGDMVDREDGLPAATCESCHGPYVRDHPDAGVIQLLVDSAVCQDCHPDTFGQWQDTTHAQAGVQCISCHVSHSQTLRLTDETLCRSCHQESLTDTFHTSHWYTDISCTNCHMASAANHDMAALAAETAEGALGTLPSHDFTAVSGENCLGCHQQDVYATPDPADREQAIRIALLAQADQVPELMAQLDSTQRSNRTLTTMTFTSLGFGIGIGGLLGVVFMLAIARFTRKREE